MNRSIPPLARQARQGDPLPLSFAQERVWLADRLVPGSPLYNVPVVLRLCGWLDAWGTAALGAALAAVVRRHDVLRTVFSLDGDQPVAAVRPPGAAALPVVDLSGLAPAARGAAAARLAAAAARRPFDLAAAPPLSALLLRHDDAHHELLLTVHHIAFDGWSLAVLGRELGALYRAFSLGEPAPLPALAVQYGDYALWQRQWLTEETLAPHLAARGRHLAGIPAALELPTDRPRPPVMTYQGGLVGLALPAGLAAGLAAFSRQHRATLFMTLAAAFAAVLHRHSGQAGFLLGTPIAGRSRPQLEPLIGFFVNTVVLRCDCAGDPGFSGLVGRIAETAIDALAHGDLPFEKLAESLAGRHDPSRTPLFQALVVWQPQERPALDFGSELTATLVPQPNGTAKFDLVLDLAAGADGCIRGHVGFRTDLFDAATARRLAAHLETLLGGAAAAPDCPLSELPLLTAAETAQLGEWRAAGLAAPAVGTGGGGDAEIGAACLHELFAAQAARTPGATALVAGAERWSYAELRAAAARLARRLQALGVGPEAGVGIHLERSAGMVRAMLATLMAGGFYVPLDPAYPAARLAHLIADSGVRVVVSERWIAERVERAEGLPPCAATVLCLEAEEPAGSGGIEPGAQGGAGSPPEAAAPDRDDRDDRDDRASAAAWAAGDRSPWAAAPGSPEAPAAPAAPTADNLAYLIYTSGSTGRPKAVAVTHRGAVLLARWAREVYSPAELAGVLAATSIAFDLSVFEIFVPLAWGGTVILAPHALALGGLPAAGEVTLINTVPSVMAELLRLGPLPAAVRTVNLAGEPLSRALADRIHALPGGLRLHNLYGPSEDTTYSTAALVERDAPRAPDIGRALPGSWAVVLDPRLRPVPIGVPGEIYLGGGGLARGYLNLPALTAERFLPDPGATVAGARLHRTGDAARFLADGALDFLGRRDHQVKVRGFRIELGEIETALAACPGVAAAAVLAPAEGEGERRLVAYVAPAELSPADLRTALLQRLPEHMVPAAWVLLPSLPRTTTGKIDRGALPAATAARPAHEPGDDAPRNPVEQALTEIWAEVLRLPRVGIHDNFFELGGDSILAIRVVTRCRRLGLDLVPHQLFREPSVAALAAALGGGPHATAAGAPPAGSPGAPPAAPALSAAPAPPVDLPRAAAPPPPPVLSAAPAAPPPTAPPAAAAGAAGEFPLAGLSPAELEELMAELSGMSDLAEIGEPPEIGEIGEIGELAEVGGPGREMASR